jgi:hypothetical protein
MSPRLHHQGGLQQELLQGLAESDDGKEERCDQVTGMVSWPFFHFYM